MLKVIKDFGIGMKLMLMIGICLALNGIYAIVVQVQTDQMRTLKIRA